MHGADYYSRLSRADCKAGTTAGHAAPSEDSAATSLRQQARLRARICREWVSQDRQVRDQQSTNDSTGHLPLRVSASDQ